MKPKGGSAAGSFRDDASYASFQRDDGAGEDVDDLVNRAAAGARRRGGGEPAVPAATAPAAGTCEWRLVDLLLARSLKTKKM